MVIEKSGWMLGKNGKLMKMCFPEESHFKCQRQAIQVIKRYYKGAEIIKIPR